MPFSIVKLLTSLQRRFLMWVRRGCRDKSSSFEMAHVLVLVGGFGLLLVWWPAYVIGAVVAAGLLFALCRDLRVGPNSAGDAVVAVGMYVAVMALWPLALRSMADLFANPPGLRRIAGRGAAAGVAVKR